MHDLELAIRFFLQLSVILCVCRAVVWVGKRMGQTPVVSEMIAGVLLGPSLFGLVAPHVQSWIFPKVLTTVVDGTTVTIPHPSMSILYVVSQLGLVLYMFLIGLEFDLSRLVHKGKAAALVSASGILAPVLLGGMLGYYLHGSSDSFTTNVSPWNAAFFLGASMAITAFPMLARILFESGMARTSMGTLALAAAAFDDGFAWCLLAIVLATYQNDSLIAIRAVGGGALFAILVLTVGARLFNRLETWRQKTGEFTPNMMIAAMTLLMLGAWCTDALGIYAVFGAFVVGAAMPKGQLSADIQANSHMLVTYLMLPLFFVYSGLNTRLELVNTPQLAMLTVLIIIVAIVSKGVACTIAARCAGESWPDATKIGTLMNARGLIELIILNIGLQAGVITRPCSP